MTPCCLGSTESQGLAGSSRTKKPLLTGWRGCDGALSSSLPPWEQRWSEFLMLNLFFGKLKILDFSSQKDASSVKISFFFPTENLSKLLSVTIYYLFSVQLHSKTTSGVLNLNLNSTYKCDSKNFFYLPWFFFNWKIAKRSVFLFWLSLRLNNDFHIFQLVLKCSSFNWSLPAGFVIFSSWQHPLAEVYYWIC